MSRPSLDEWLREAKADPSARQCGMYLVHNGTVRVTPKASVRGGEKTEARVLSLRFSHDAKRLEEAVSRVRTMPGIFYVRVWLNEGTLPVGDDLMLVLVGGDIRPRVVDALQSLVEEIKTSCVSEQEVYEDSSVQPPETGAINPITSPSSSF